MVTRKVQDYEVIDHGVDNEQYFQGCGVSFTSFEECFTGCGASAHDALEDALEGAAGAGWDVDDIPCDLSDEPDIPSEKDKDGDDIPVEGVWHYVSIRLR